MKAIGVVKIVEYVSFMSLPCNMHDALSVHASCTSLYVCMMPIHYLVHGFKLADTIYAHTTYCNEKKSHFCIHAVITSALPNIVGSALT